MHQTHSERVKSALEQREDPGSFLLARVVSFEVCESPDMTGPVRKVSS
jgi:hypothetical protein